MIRKFLFCIMILCSVAVSAHEYRWKVESVYDGDTIRVAPSWLPPELKLKVRVLGIDTPEKGWRAKCAYEHDLAEKATEFVVKKIQYAIDNRKRIAFRNIKWDKYGGRVDATVIIAGENLSDSLIAAGLARPYFGGKKEPWCTDQQ